MLRGEADHRRRLGGGGGSEDRQRLAVEAAAPVGQPRLDLAGIGDRRPRPEPFVDGGNQLRLMIGFGFIGRAA